MKKIIYCLLILGFLTSCKECKPGQNEPEVSFEVDGIYGVYETRILYTLAKSDISFDYKAVCIEIQKPDVFVVRFLNTEKKKDIHMKWEKAEEGKYKINYKDQTAFFYDYKTYKNPKHPNLIYMLSLKETKPLESDNDYTSMTKLFNYPTLDECTEYEKGQLDQESDPGPDN